jgi:hypothetical protein
VIRYEHTQRGTVVQAALAVGALVCFGLAQFLSAPPFVIPMALALVVICAYMFSSLTIQITDRTLRWCFGPGMFRKELALAEIAAVEVTRTRLLEGWGIHRTSRGWLYNVSGFDAVLLRLSGGKRVLLGTDEPERLRAAILLGMGRARSGK